jgi:NADPH2:quinone reductase
VLFHYTAPPEILREMAGNLFSLIRRGVLRVRIGARHKLADAAQAHRDLEARRTTGSTILIP